MRSLHRYLIAAGVASLLVIATACSKPADAPTGTATPASPPSSDADTSNAKQIVVTAVFAHDDAATNYNKTLVPDGAKVLVAENVFDGATTVTLNVRGLVPNRAYGAHAHAMPCGPTGEAAGPHFQHTPDPVKPSVDPAFANSANEIWLDFKTDAQGDATTASTVPWVFTNAKAASVVIHADPTQTTPGKAGTAGARVGCVSVGF
ncbi:MAG: superoxide dismutase, Cu-Zn family [Pseudonocardiales bacterium]|jgi:Cu-Zn family superoxide dismutase|nr:superoxide dismutase, Cu-Zn family [Pseudonocardiales bacterium]MDT7773825.1 superoxide dismutase, Cu-Zn family [Pseudonocardiales bacterium]